MTDETLRDRLLAQPVGGRYGLFLILGLVFALAGLALFIPALMGENADRAWHLFLVNWLFFTSLSAGSVALAAVHKIANAKWSGMILRYAEASSAFLPLSFIGFLLIIGPGYHHIFPEFHGLGHSKELWLSRPWMFWRLFIGLGALYTLSLVLVRADMVADVHALARQVSGTAGDRFQRMAARAGYDGSVESEIRQEKLIHRLAPIYIVVYALVMTMVAFDLIMALQPHWFSNLLGGFFFMGAFLSAHMLLALMMMFGGNAMGLSDLISGKQRHDLGKLCFGFTVFWAYLMWSQFLVIWYGNLPEETGFVFARLYGPWLPVGRAVLLGMFVVPFIGLLGTMPKKLKPTLAFFAVVSLVAFWLERYLLVMPSVTREASPIFGLPELGPTLLLAGLFLLAYWFFTQRYPMVSPRLAMITVEGERHHLESMFEHDESEKDYTPEARV
jgi:Ni/Fe-hydrogenase subunit HybB-like protein